MKMASDADEFKEELQRLALTSNTAL